MKELNKSEIKESIFKEIDSNILLKGSMQGIEQSIKADYKRLLDNGVWSTEVDKSIIFDYLNHNLTLILESSVDGSKLHLLLSVGNKLGYEVIVKVLNECITVVYTVHSEKLTNVEF